MAVYVFDIGGSSIKNGVCVLENLKKELFDIINQIDDVPKLEYLYSFIKELNDLEKGGVNNG